jgi:hypothetical protein
MSNITQRFFVDKTISRVGNAMETHLTFFIFYSVNGNLTSKVIL